MALNEGDVVRFDYTLRIDGDVREVSSEKAAKDAGIFVEDRKYEPLTFSVGGRQILPSLEAAVVSHKKGDAFTVDLEAKDAYGIREPGNIETIPMAQFRKQNVKPEVGQILNWNNKRAIVTQIGGGRVRIDMNHELAGKDLQYEVKIVEVLTDDNDKLDAVLRLMFPEGAEFQYDGKELILEVPDQAKFSQDWPMMKFRVLTQMRQVIGMDKPVSLVEKYPAMPADLPGAQPEVAADSEE